ncbi:MAG: arsenite methyltransferase [Planctomycetota bacterium]
MGYKSPKHRVGFVERLSSGHARYLPRASADAIPRTATLEIRQSTRLMSPSAPKSPVDVLETVQSRYAQGAAEQVPELCCPVDYDASLLEVLPPEIIDRDYGCGDPSRFVRNGDTVLDLGSGAGKICYMASQLTGAEGRVIGVDATPEMLALSREWVERIGERIGWTNTEFRHGLIQDLALDRDALAEWLAKNPIASVVELDALRIEEDRLRRESPLIPDNSIDLVLSNCVLNLVDNSSKVQLFNEIARVMKAGGRCAISDIVCDEDVPQDMQDDPELWSGCISGAMREDRFLQAFKDAGLHGVQAVEYQSEPWAVVRGIEFRSMTVVAWKAEKKPALEQNDAILYRGPWKEVVDDFGNTLRRGERTAVSRRTAELLGSEPYADQLVAIKPLMEVPADEVQPFGCNHETLRSPSETKHGVQRADVAPGTSSSSCC